MEPNNPKGCLWQWRQGKLRREKALQQDKSSRSGAGSCGQGILRCLNIQLETGPEGGGWWWQIETETLVRMVPSKNSENFGPEISAFPDEPDKTRHGEGVSATGRNPAHFGRSSAIWHWPRSKWPRGIESPLQCFLWATAARALGHREAKTWKSWWIRNGHPFKHQWSVYKHGLGRPFREEVAGALMERLDATRTPNIKHPFFWMFWKDIIPYSNTKAASIQKMWSQDSYHPFVGEWLHIWGKTSEREIKWLVTKIPITKWRQLARNPKRPATKWPKLEKHLSLSGSTSEQQHPTRGQNQETEENLPKFLLLPNLSSHSVCAS